MKTFTWFLLFVLFVSTAFGYYAYKYVYIPKIIMLSRLKRENLKLKYEIQDKLNKAYRECSKKDVNKKFTGANDSIPSVQNKVSIKDSVKAAEPIAFSFSVKDLFKKSSLSIRGKALVKEFYSEIKDKDFDSIRVIINRKNQKAARKVLNIKKYLVSLGLEKDRVWARLSDDVPRDSVIFKLIW